MKITPVNNKYQYTPQKPAFKGIVEDFGVAAKDVFTKTKIEDNEKIILLDMFKKAYSELVKPERFLGSGFFGNVYAIDNNFVAKIRKNARNVSDFINGEFKLGKNIFKDLHTYYGEPLVKIGQVSILKNAGRHIPVGVPSNIVKKMESLEECEKYYQENYLPIFAKVPQESYDNLIKDISKLNKMKSSEGEYYFFDSQNPGNIVLSDNKLLLIDEIDSCNYISDNNSVGKILEVMLYKLTLYRPVTSYGNNVDDAREILRKIIIASEKAELPYDTRCFDENVWRLVLYNSNIKMDVNDFIMNLELIRRRNPDLSKRIPKVEEFLNSVYKRK